MEGDLFNNTVGDFIGSLLPGYSAQEKANESALKDAEVQRQLNEALLEQMKNKKVGASLGADTSNQKYIILGGVALVMVFAIVMIS
jgi:hypothetical protein